MRFRYILLLVFFLGGCDNDSYCPEGQSWCWAKCVDLVNDNENCGSCDNQCGPLSSCQNGECECAGGLTNCDGQCVNLDFDIANCGACNSPCGAEQTCVDGTCQCMDLCDDQNECTEDICDAEHGCVHENLDGITCDDGDPCTHNDMCYEGICSGLPVDIYCSDECLIGHCDTDTGEQECIPREGPCDDDDQCSSQDTCQDGVCTTGPTDKDTDGDNYLDDSCQGGNDCDDSDPNVNPEEYEGPPGSPICFDGVDNDCDSLTDLQDPGCPACSGPEVCDDGNVCNGIEDCDPAIGCLPGTPLDCDDGDYCTEDACDPADGSCSNAPVPDGTACYDGDDCTINDQCESGACAPGILWDDDGDGYGPTDCGGNDCDDGNPSVNTDSIEGPPGHPVCSNGLDDDCDGSSDLEDFGCYGWNRMCSTDGWCWENPLPQGNALLAVWGSSSNDFWIVGYGGTILHWDGTAWSGVQSGTTLSLFDIWGTVPDYVWIASPEAIFHWDGNSLSNTYTPGTVYPFGISGTSTTDVWAVGVGDSVLHWDGSSWSTVPWQGSGNASLDSVWANTTDDTWAVGHSGSIHHWNGSQWAVVESDVGSRLNDVFGFSDDDVWAGGKSLGSSQWDNILLHWNGTEWIRVDASQTGIPNIETHGIWGAAPNDVWAAAQPLFHWDGSNWSSIEMENGNGLNALWGSAADDIWGVGNSVDDNKIFHYDGNMWKRVSDSITDRELYAIWANSDDDVWVGGSAGTILHRDEFGWSKVESGKIAIVEAMWGSGPNDVFAVGRASPNGVNALHWNGIDWTEVDTGTDTLLSDIWGLSSNAIWVVGDGTVLHWDGVTWSDMDPRTPSVSLQGVWASASDDLWVVGEYATILRWDGTTWSTFDMNLGSGTWIFGVWGSGPNDVLAVGGCRDTCGSYCELDLILRWDGTTWTVDDSIPRFGAIYRSVFGFGPNDVWAVGSICLDNVLTSDFILNVLLHWDGISWTRVQTGSMWFLDEIGGTPGGRLWVVGSYGNILSYQP